jgi:hypothetical protein
MGTFKRFWIRTKIMPGSYRKVTDLCFRDLANYWSVRLNIRKPIYVSYFYLTPCLSLFSWFSNTKSFVYLVNKKSTVPVTSTGIVLNLFTGTGILNWGTFFKDVFSFLERQKLIQEVAYWRSQVTMIFCIQYRYRYEYTHQYYNSVFFMYTVKVEMFASYLTSVMVPKLFVKDPGPTFLRVPDPT